MPYKKYIQAISEMNNLISSSTEDEIKRYSESDIYWVRNKSVTDKKVKYHKGDVCQFEFGKNYIPEMSYEHRGLIIGVNNKLLYVLPICSKRSSNSYHLGAYHPIDNPTSSDYYLLKNSEYPFLKHDSILKLNDLRTVSIARSKYKQGSINLNSKTFIEIEEMTFSKHFPTYSYKYNKLADDYNMLLLENQELMKALDEYKKTLDEVASANQTLE